MNVTKEKLINLLNNKLEKNSRFETLGELFSNIINEKNTITFDDEKKEVTIGDTTLAYKTDANSEEVLPTIEYFGPSKDNMTVDRAFSGVAKMAEKFGNHKDLANKIGSVLGGFDFDSHKMMDKYRIISNTITAKDDYKGSLTSQGQIRHPSSHFADNNYFFNIMSFIQKCKNEPTVKFEDSVMVLRYPNNHINSNGKKSYFHCENDDENNTNEYAKQRGVLKNRFPPKFLWMWANKDIVIHPYSLMAFRNFLNTDYGKSLSKNIDGNDYTPEDLTNMEFEKFLEVWKKISNKVLTDLKIEINKNNISNISKLISNIMTQETDIKNISDLLLTGNKAVIIWGPPGTGKTYESMDIVKELLNIEEKKDEITEEEYSKTIEDRYLFSKQDINTNTLGYYEIIQFHPNYTYEDFIGGISPKIDSSNDVSYELRKGIFYKFCKEAEKNLNQDYIFIIDEINRAELSAVFGELLFALEYRGKHINLPHFGSFTIPKNVFILGTMNNVDKSLVTFDLALRRRFGFFKLMPKLDVINDVLGDMVEENSLNKYIDKCKELNKKIIDDLGLGEDYQIGQAYFLKIKDFFKDRENVEISSFDLERLWVYNIEPLLEEYLGMSIEDDGIQKKLSNLKDFFEK